MEIPAIARILIVFAGMLTLTRVKVPLGAALVLGGIALNAWAGESVAAIAQNLMGSLQQLNLWLLLIITSVIMEFGPLVGMAAGCVHLLIVERTAAWHGGLDLYNNGFAGGLTAALFVAVIQWVKSTRETTLQTRS